MPELPEVETIKRDLQKTIIGLNICGVKVFDSRVLKGINQTSFIRKLAKQKISDIQRRAKAVIIVFDSGLFLSVQPKMTGVLTYGDQPILKETKVIFHLSNDKILTYNDQRIFGRLILTDDLSKIPYFNTLGPEPLTKFFNVGWVESQIKRRTISIKQLLLNQSFVAGIGNIYASEILFLAKISPLRRPAALKKKDIEALIYSTVKVLNEAVRFRGTSMRNYRDASGQKGKFMNRIKVYNRTNEDCVNCRTPITRIVQGARSTFYCRKCQK